MAEIIDMESEVQYVNGPPREFADVLAEAFPDGQRYVVVRRIKAAGFAIFPRWDATEWVVHGAVENPRTLHQMLGRHACIVRCGFGFTRRAALRSCRRAKDEELPLGESLSGGSKS